MVSLTAPYLSGFLAFREVPFLVDAVRRLQEKDPSLMPQAGTSKGLCFCTVPTTRHRERPWELPGGGGLCNEDRDRTLSKTGLRVVALFLLSLDVRA